MKKLIIFIMTMTLIIVIFSCKKDEPSGGSGNQDSGSWQTVFFDDFNRADGGLGSNWEYSDTINLKILSNQVKSSTETVAFYTTNVNDNKIKLTAKFIGDGAATYASFDLIARATIDGSYNFIDGYAVAFRWNEATASSVMIGKRTSGSWNFLSSEDYTFSPGTIYNLEMIIDNNLITVNLKDSSNNVLKTLSITDSSYTTGKVGFGAGINSSNMAYIDDFKVEKYEQF